MNGSSKFSRRWVLAALIVAAVAASCAYVLLRDENTRSIALSVLNRVLGGSTEEEQVQKHGPEVAARFARRFSAAGLQYPPLEVTFLAFKRERVLQVYARASEADPWRYVSTYSIKGLSGTLGPKLKEGDRQVPEGVYSVEYLNPNSRYHLSLRLNYPNAFDRAMAARDGRTRLGSDIMIHGTSLSIGCIAVGNVAAEDLFVLAALVSKERVRVIIAPVDLRVTRIPVDPKGPDWVAGLYQGISDRLREYPLPFARVVQPERQPAAAALE